MKYVPFVLLSVIYTVIGHWGWGLFGLFLLVDYVLVCKINVTSRNAWIPGAGVYYYLRRQQR